MLPTMFVLLLLLFQPRYAWDAQEGVVGVPVPDQQLLVWRYHLEREIQMGVSRGDRKQPPVHPQQSLQTDSGHTASPERPRESSAGTFQQSPACLGQTQHSPGCSTTGDGMAQHHPSRWNIQMLEYPSIHPYQGLPQAGPQTARQVNKQLQSRQTELRSLKDPEVPAAWGDEDIAAHGDTEK